MTFPFTTVMRLEVRALSTFSPRNVVQNALPAGRIPLGAWGYVTPLANSVLETVAGTANLRYRTTATQASYFLTEGFAVSPGEKAAGRLNVEALNTSTVNETARVRLQFVDDAGTVLLQTAQSAAAFTGEAASPAAVAPAGTTQVRMRVDVYTSGGNMTAGRFLAFGSVAIMVGPTVSGPPSGPGFYESWNWVNIFNDSTSVTVEREDLNGGSLSVSIPDADYDPSLNTLLRPGRRVRLSTVISGTTRNLFSGKITDAQVVYNPRRTDDKRALITLTASDAAADLANVARPDGYATINGLRAVLEGAGVPWRINGNTSQILPPAVVSRNESASALDQIAITRDSVRGYAWIDRDGVLVAKDPGWMSGATDATYTETSYTKDLDVGFNLERIINVVTIKHLRVNAATGETVEVTYGPYARSASVEEWGARAAEFTVQGLTDNDATMRAFAEEVFDASATPQVRVNALTLLVRSSADVAPNAHRELYDLVRVTNANTGIDQTARITKITHRITPRNWFVDLGFDSDGGVAAPRPSPALASPASAAGEDTHHAARNHSTGVNMSNNTETLILWNNAEHLDGFTYNAATGEFTVPARGRYQVSASLGWLFNSTGIRSVRIVVNGVNARLVTSGTSNVGVAGASIGVPLKLNAGDKITIRGLQQSGGSLALAATGSVNTVDISYLGPAAP